MLIHPLLRASRFVVCVAVLLSCAACRRPTGFGQGDAAVPTFVPSDAGQTAASVVTVTVEPDGTGVAQGLLSAIAGATSAVHVEMYLLTNDTYIDALSRLATKGIDVEVILNETFPSGTAASDTNARSYESLADEGVAVRWAPTNTGFDGYTHEKAVIIDPGTPTGAVWVMTMNLDDSGPTYNREYLACDTSPADVAEAEAIFEADYDDVPITAEGALVVAPSPQNDAEQVLLGLVEGATDTIDMEAEEFDDAGLEASLFSALTAKARAGVAVRLVLEDASDAAQADAVAELEAAGGMVSGYAYGSGSGLDIHAKALVVDGARAYVGSVNFSGGSLGYNRELGVTFTEATEVEKVDATIVADFQGGTPYTSG